MAHDVSSERRRHDVVLYHVRLIGSVLVYLVVKLARMIYSC